MKNNQMVRVLCEKLQAKIHRKTQANIWVRAGAPMIPICCSEGKPNRPWVAVERKVKSSKEQREAILKHLENYLWIDGMYAAAELHIWDLPSRIRTLQRQGHKIFKCWTFSDQVPRYGFIRKIDWFPLADRTSVKPEEEKDVLISAAFRIGFDVDGSTMTSDDWFDLYWFIRHLHWISNR